MEILGFRPWNVTATRTTTTTGSGCVGAERAILPFPVCRLMSESHEHTLFELAVVETARYSGRITTTLSVIDIKIFPVLAATSVIQSIRTHLCTAVCGERIRCALLFPLVVCSCSCLWTLFPSLTSSLMSTIPALPLEFR